MNDNILLFLKNIKYQIVIEYDKNESTKIILVL